MCSLNGWLHTCAEEPTVRWFAAYGVYVKRLDTVGPLYFDYGIVLVQRYFIVIADSVHCIRIVIRGGGGGATMSMIQNNDVLSPEKYTNDLINSKSAQTICNVTSQFQVCRCYGPFVRLGPALGWHSKRWYWIWSYDWTCYKRKLHIAYG